MKRYSVSYKDRLNFVSLVLLNEIIQFQHYFPVTLTGEDEHLSPYLNHMKTRGVLDIVNGKYVPTEKGREELVRLYDKYNEYLKIFDIFCAVDLEAGEFAFASILDEMSEEEWQNHLHDPRFSDVRVAVSDFKGLNPVEIVFLSFLNENRFDCTVEGWQAQLTTADIWVEIEDICNSAISVEYLSQDGVLEDVIKQGSALALDIIKESQVLLAQEEQFEEDEVVTETIVTTEVVEEYVDVVEQPYYSYDYYYPYYDPFYVSPLWLAVVLL